MKKMKDKFVSFVCLETAVIDCESLGLDMDELVMPRHLFTPVSFVEPVLFQGKIKAFRQDGTARVFEASR